ncbi:MAG: glycosyltransferase family 2 protein [Candidatus Omnitrophica bacterium]|nr:glycosyltransferase family 2 protein [Candidatus Omnitrophota bacterium]
MHNVSVLVLTCNNERIIRRCLESVKGFAQIVICDSFSSDNTVSICREYTDTIYYYAHESPSVQRNWAISRCSHEWVLQVDTDEIVTEELISEIKERMSHETIPYDAFQTPTINHIFNRWVRGADLYPGRRIRLFKKTFRYDGRWIHEQLIVEGNVGQLQGHVLHYGFEDWKIIKQKLGRYRRLEHLQRIQEGKKTKPYQLLTYPLGVFIYLFFIRKGFIDGWRGLLWACFVSVLKFLVYKDSLCMRK